MTPLLSAPLLRTQSDGRLASLAARGHDRAFEAIVERYRRPLQRYLRRLLSEPLADDVLQATFVRAWQALRAGTEVRDLRPWLYRIAHNQALNALRAAAPPLPAGAQALPAMSIESEFERREELRETLEGIESLPERQRAALVAVAVADRPHADVAAELGLSDGALRQLLLRARTALRAAATALTPYPLVSWLAAGQETGAGRVAEVAAGAGGAGLAVKAGAAVLAASAVVVGAPVLHERHASEDRAVAAGAKARHRAASPEVPPTATSNPDLGVSKPIIVRGAPAVGGAEDEADHGKAKPARKHHHGSSGSASRGPGSAGEQESASGSGDDSGEGGGDEGAGGSGSSSSGRHTSGKSGSDDGRDGSGESSGGGSGSSGGDDGAAAPATLQPVAPVVPETETESGGDGSGSSGSGSSGSGSGDDGSGHDGSGGD